MQIITITNADSRFYPMLGPFLASREVARHVGGEIWDDDGKAWHVALDGSGQVAGFIATRPGRGAVTVESCYAPQPGLRPQLIAAVVEHTEPSHLTTIVRNEWAGDYTAAGFAVTKTTANFTTLAR